MNFDSLVLDLQHYMVRYDQPYINKIPDLIQQGIIRIYNRAKDLGFEIITVHRNIAAGTINLPMPAGWFETISFQMINPVTQDVTFLQPRSYEFCRTYWPFYQNVTRAKPKYYAHHGQNNNNARLNDPYSRGIYMLCPVPDIIYNFDIIYHGIPLFNENNQTNFLTQRYPDLLLYSCLIEACLFLDNPAKLAEYKNLFNEELDTINKINKDRSADRTIIRENN
jgi:hypothetical protein